tara:strand:+ start:202 stop:375 length:174 start_codon:yes stop_codon:yes gene_type:complete
MILYTEAQLNYAYISYVREAHKQNLVVVPTIEEFRLLFEEREREKLEEQENGLGQDW